MDWFKTYQDGILRGSLSTSDEKVQLIWVKLLAMENETRLRDGYLHYAEGRPMSRDYIATVCNVTRADLDYALTEYLGDLDIHGHSRIEIMEDGDIFIKNWDKYQAKPKSMIEREQAAAASKDANKRNRASLENATLALTRRVNELNVNLTTNRYMAREDGGILDTKTGNIIELEVPNED